MTTHTATSPVERAVDQKVRSARQGLLVFTIFLIPLSLFGYWFDVVTNDLPLNLSTLPMMFAPGLASIITRLLRREGFGDVSFRLRGVRLGNTILFAFGFPLVIGVIAYGFAFLSGLAVFEPPSMPLAEGAPLVRFAAGLALAGTLGFLLGFPTSTGEEIGWRGYLLPRLVEARIPQPIMLTSLIWGAWHLPVLFAGAYETGPSAWVSAVGLMVGTFCFGAILAWLRLRTGSIWPCIITHTAWNALLNAGFTLAVQNYADNMWIGESGILVVVTVVIAVLLLRRTWNPSLINK